MRHIEEGDLGVGHNLVKINKTCMAQLRNTNFKREIIKLSPEYIYIDLGINDIQQHSHPEHIVSHLENFLDAVSQLKIQRS